MSGRAAASGARERRCRDGRDAGQAGAERRRPEPEQHDQHDEDRRGRLADPRPGDPNLQGALVDQHRLHQDERDPGREDDRLPERGRGGEPHQGQGGDGGPAMRAGDHPTGDHGDEPDGDHDHRNPAGFEGMDRIAGERLQEDRDADQQRVPRRDPASPGRRRPRGAGDSLRLGRGSGPVAERPSRGSRLRPVRCHRRCRFDSLARARAAPARPIWPWTADSIPLGTPGP